MFTRFRDAGVDGAFSEVRWRKLDELKLFLQLIFLHRARLNYPLLTNLFCRFSLVFCVFSVSSAPTFNFFRAMWGAQQRSTAIYHRFW